MAEAARTQCWRLSKAQGWPDYGSKSSRPKKRPSKMFFGQFLRADTETKKADLVCRAPNLDLNMLCFQKKMEPDVSGKTQLLEAPKALRFVTPSWCLVGIQCPLV